MTKTNRFAWPTSVTALIGIAVLALTSALGACSSGSGHCDNAGPLGFCADAGGTDGGSIIDTGQPSNDTGQPAHDSCTPQCSGKSCGPDGCGGSCGTCASGQSCSPSGVCGGGCTPSCSGRACGSDGCGGSCGTCPGGGSCNNGQCVCAPNCAGKACGPDGCGGSCGTCPGGDTCNNGTCVCTPNCSGHACGPDGCGGSCGTCPTGETCSATGQCLCTPTGGSCTENGNCCDYQSGTGYCTNFGSGGICADSCQNSSQCVSGCCANATNRVCAPQRSDCPVCGAGNFTVNCGTFMCPAFSTCGANNTCTCIASYHAYTCAGTPCTSAGQCQYPNWWCD